jgi:hypothetical protein
MADKALATNLPVPAPPRLVLVVHPPRLPMVAARAAARAVVRTVGDRNMHLASSSDVAEPSRLTAAPAMRVGLLPWSRAALASEGARSGVAVSLECVERGSVMSLVCSAEALAEGSVVSSVWGSCAAESPRPTSGEAIASKEGILVGAKMVDADRGGRVAVGGVVRPGSVSELPPDLAELLRSTVKALFEVETFGSDSKALCAGGSLVLSCSAASQEGIKGADVMWDVFDGVLAGLLDTIRSSIPVALRSSMPRAGGRFPHLCEWIGASALASVPRAFEAATPAADVLAAGYPDPDGIDAKQGVTSTV